MDPRFKKLIEKSTRLLSEFEAVDAPMDEMIDAVEEVIAEWESVLECHKDFQKKEGS